MDEIDIKIQEYINKFLNNQLEIYEKSNKKNEYISRI